MTQQEVAEVKARRARDGWWMVDLPALLADREALIAALKPFGTVGNLLSSEIADGHSLLLQWGSGRYLSVTAAQLRLAGALLRELGVEL